MLEILYFTDIVQVRYVAEKSPHLFRQMRPMTGEIVVADEFERLHIPFIDEWQYLENSDIERNFEAANNLSARWWDRRIPEIEYKGLPLSEAARQDLVFAFEAALNAKVVYNRILSSAKIEKVSGFFLPPAGVVRTGPLPTHRAVRSVAQAVLFWATERLQIPIVRLTCDRPLSRGTLPRRMSARQGAGRRETRGGDEIPLKSAMILEDGMPVIEREKLQGFFAEIGGWKVFSLSQEELQAGIEVEERQEQLQTKLQGAWEAFVGLTSVYDGPSPELFGNRHLFFQFKRIWDEMEAAIECGKVFSKFLHVLKPSIIVFGHEAFTFERVLESVAQTNRIPTISFFHGGLGTRASYRGLVGGADSVLVWNEVDVELLSFYGVPKERLHKVGCMRYEGEHESYARLRNNGDIEARRSAKRRMGISAEKPVILLLTAAINSGFSAPIADPKRHREALKELLEVIKARQDLTFVIKPHPAFDHYELYRKFTDLGLSNLVMLEQAELSESIETSDVCVMINYCTSAALEAMLGRKPVIFLNSAVYAIDSWRDNLYPRGMNRVKTVVELERAIDELLTNPEVMRNSLEEADRTINRMLDLAEQPAHIRLHEHVDRLTRGQDGSLIGDALSQAVFRDSGGRSDWDRPNNVDDDGGSHSFVLAYLAGVYRLGFPAITRMVRRQTEGGKTKGLRMKNFLTQAYILGFVKGRTYENWIPALRLFAWLLVHPGRFLSATAQLKTRVVKYVVRTLVGEQRWLADTVNWVFRNVIHR